MLSIFLNFHFEDVLKYFQNNNQGIDSKLRHNTFNESKHYENIKMENRI